MIKYGGVFRIEPPRAQAVREWRRDVKLFTQLAPPPPPPPPTGIPFSPVTAITFSPSGLLIR